VTWLNIVPPLIPGLIALGIALVNGRRHDLEIERQNKRHDWQESLNLIRQKVEEYHLKTTALFNVFSKWQNKLNAGDTQVEETKQEYLSVEAFLTMLEGLYFPFFKSGAFLSSEVGSQLFGRFLKLTEERRKLAEKGVTASWEQQESFKKEWTLVRDEFLKQSKRTQEFLEELDTAEIAEQYRQSNKGRQKTAIQ